MDTLDVGSPERLARLALDAHFAAQGLHLVPYVVAPTNKRPGLRLSDGMLSRSSHPAHQIFWSHILGFRKAPSRFASLFPEAWRAIATAECYSGYLPCRMQRICDMLGRVCRRFVYRAFCLAFRVVDRPDRQTRPAETGEGCLSGIGSDISRCSYRCSQR
jgi:hypothetical protein